MQSFIFICRLSDAARLRCHSEVSSILNKKFARLFFVVVFIFRFVCGLQSDGDANSRCLLVCLDGRETKRKLQVFFYRWLFTLITISSYTAQLAAFLTVERMTTAIERFVARAFHIKEKQKTLLINV